MTIFSAWGCWKEHWTRRPALGTARIPQGIAHFPWRSPASLARSHPLCKSAHENDSRVPAAAFSQKAGYYRSFSRALLGPRATKNRGSTRGSREVSVRGPGSGGRPSRSRDIRPDPPKANRENIVTLLPGSSQRPPAGWRRRKITLTCRLLRVVWGLLKVLGCSPLSRSGANYALAAQIHRLCQLSHSSPIPCRSRA